MDDAMVFSLADSVSRDKGMHYGLLRLGLEPEKAPGGSAVWPRIHL